MIFDFSKIDQRERPVLKLKNAGGKVLGVLGFVENLGFDIKYNEISCMTFEVPKFVDGTKVPFYELVEGFRTVEMNGIAQFVLLSPEETGDGVDVRKACKAYSLEQEFTFKRLTLEEGTYNFWNPLAPEDTLLSILLELMPSWSVGYVSPTLVGKYRTFSESGRNLYDFMKQTAQKTYRCIFDFDTINRIVNVYDVEEAVVSEPVFISSENLSKEFSVTENTDKVITRLDVNGADGVTIRDVNPCGTNTIINLDYYMTPDNFSQELIDKYGAWKKLFDESQSPYYNACIAYSLEVMRRATEEAALTDLRGELTALENNQAVTIQAISAGIQNQQALDGINAQISRKQAEINEKSALVETLRVEVEQKLSVMRAITEACRFESYFTSEEYKLLDRFLIDDSIAENTFVVSEADSYSARNASESIANTGLSASDCALTQIQETDGSILYDIAGGSIVVGSRLRGAIVNMSMRRKNDSSFVATAYLSKGAFDDWTFEKACVTLTGAMTTVTTDAAADDEKPGVLAGTALSAQVANATVYYSEGVSEYQRRMVAWELFEYGQDILSRMASPTYTFTVDSSNFLCLDDFVNFKNSLQLGHKIYVDLSDKGILRPIVIGAKFSYAKIDELQLEFSDTFSSRNAAFELADLLEQSISAGRSVSANKFSYAAFMDSGANTSISHFMSSALDVSKNAILSSKDQAVSWDEAGLRLRKWTDAAKTAYEREQIWANNNSILLTRDNWATATMAIGKFHDTNLGECYGIVAPTIVGTLLAGNTLIIESAKKDGGVAVFRMDGNGCTLHNSDFSIVGNGTQIVLNPQIGIAIGANPVYTVQDGTYKIDENKAKFWVDTAGNLHFKGTLNAADGKFSGELKAATGSFTGSVTATSLVIQDAAGETLNGFIDNNKTVAGASSTASSALNAANSASAAASNIHNGTTGISFNNGTALAKCEINTKNGLKLTGSGGDYFQATNSAMGFYDTSGKPMLKFEKGNLTVSGTLSGCTGEFTGTVYATSLYIGSGRTSLSSYIGDHDTVKDAAKTAQDLVDGTTAAGKATVAMNVETQNTKVSIGDDGVFIKTGGVFVVESGNFSIDSNGFLRADDAYINGTLMSNGRPVLTRADIYVGSSAPANPTLGMVWIQPIQSSTQTATSTEHTYMWGAVDRLGLSSNHRTGVLSGSGVAAAGSNYTYDITVAVYASTNVSNVTVYLTLSSGGKSHTFTGTVSGIGHLLVDLSGTSSVWLAGTNSISFELSASSNNLLNDRNNHYISVKSYSNS